MFVPQRHKTVTVPVGPIQVGSCHQVVVQSMTNTDTANAESTAKQVAELYNAGSELVRITVNTQEAAAAVPEIQRRLHDLGLNVPMIGDFHYNGHVLLEKYPECAEILAKYRINPGNVGKGANHDKNFATMVQCAIDHKKPVRIGVNAGSLDQTLLNDLMETNAKSSIPQDAQTVFLEAMVQSAVRSAHAAEELGLRREQIILSCKISRVQELVRVYRALADRTDHALHLGLTEAGMGHKGIVSSTAGLAILLQEGIGDTIRVSLSAPPVEEVKVGIQILQSLNLKERKLEIVSCPSCGRAQVDVYELAEKVTAGLEGMEVPLRVAVMGCVVNGPGEAREADLGVASGNGKGQIFVRGEVIKTVAEKDIVETLIEEALKLAATMEPVEGSSPQVVTAG